MTDRPSLTMRADILREWIDDLRSGSHLQGHGALCQGSAWCCLGRLGAICASHGHGAMAEGSAGLAYQLPSQVGLTVDLGEDDDESLADPYGEYEVLPQELLDWLGTEKNHSHAFLRVQYEGALVELFDLNDGRDGRPPLAFPQIADLIEAQIQPIEPVDQPTAA